MRTKDPALRFCGQEPCRIDVNGRIRLPPEFLNDFQQTGSQDVVLHCLPEGALAVYPLDVWRSMQAAEPRPAMEAARSAAVRRRLRRSGAMSVPARLTNQGRITIPHAFREGTGLAPGAEAVLVGCRIGVEVWSRERWEQEVAALQEYERRRTAAEMEAELGAMGVESPSAPDMP